MTDPISQTNSNIAESIARTGESPVLSPVLSVVIPMYNEAGVVGEFVKETAAALVGLAYEIIVIDDCSTDETRAKLLEAKRDTATLRVLAHGENAGQSRAIRTGVIAARADIIATLDGDGQNDPADIAELFERLTAKGRPDDLAMVAGERLKRRDSATKRAGSKFANWVRKGLLGDGAADTGCGLKVFRRDAFLSLPFFDHMHRYLPALMVREGYRVEFIGVNHRERAHGVSKYSNFGRLLVAFRDLAGVLWLKARAKSPGKTVEL